MTSSDSPTNTVPVQLPNGALVKVEVAPSGREDVGFDAHSFKGVTDAIEGVADAITDSLKKASPSKASVKFGLEIQVEQGSLVAALVRGTGKTSLEITLEWENPKPVTLAG